MSKNTKLVLGVAALVVVGALVLTTVNSYKEKRGQKVTNSAGSGYTAESPMSLSYGDSNDASDQKYSVPRQPMTSEEMRIAQPPLVDSKTTPRMIVKNGAVSLVVKNVGETLVAIKTYAESNSGFVVESNTYKSGNAPYGVITVRIPSKTFEASVGSIKALGDVVSENIHGTDVTAEYVDLDGQLKNLRAAEQQFLDIMKRAGTITEVLAVQNELIRVRAQIESIQGRMKYLKETSEMSSLTVNLSTDPSALPIVETDSSKWKPLVVVKDALRSLLEVGKRFVNSLIWIVIFIPVWGGALLITWIIYKKIQNNKSRK